MRRVLETLAIFIVLASLLALPGIAFAEGETEGERKETGKKAEKLDELVVTGQADTAPDMEDKIPMELAEVGHPLVVITSEEIEDSGFVDLAQILESLVPGFWTSNRAGRGSYTYPSIHGSNKILLLLDGVRISNRIYGNSMENYMNFISPHSIERIEVLKSGESLYYGTDAVAGVINIITREITEQTSGEVGGSYGAKEYMDAFGHATGTYSGHGMMVYASAEKWDGYVACDDQAYEDVLNFNKKKSTGYDRQTVGAKYRKSFDLAGKATVYAQGLIQQGHFDYGYPNYDDVFSDWEEKLFFVKWDHDVNDNFSYYLKSYAHTWWSKATFQNLDGSYLSDAAPWGYEDYGVNLMTSTRFCGGQEVIAGIDFQDYWGKDDFGMANFRGENELVFGFFASYRPYLPFSPKTKMALGARYDKTSDTDATVWDVSVKTPIYGPTYFRGVVNTAFTLPNVQQMYGTNPLTNRYGNPDLDPEKSFNVETGVGVAWRYINVDVGYFYRGIEDMISSVTLDDGRRTYENTSGTTKIQGAEASVGIGPFKGVSFHTSATWTNAEDKDTGDQLELIPKFFAKFNLQYRHPSGHFGGDLLTRYTGSIYERGLSYYDDVKYGDYFIADVSVFVKLGKEKRHRLVLRVENIFDKQYATRYYSGKNSEGETYLYHFDGLPRNAVLEYSYSF